MIGLDTSVVLRLLINEQAAQAKAAEKFLNQIFESGDKAAVSDLVVSESYFALQHHYQIPKENALEALNKLFQSGEIISTGHARTILKNTKSLPTTKPGFAERLRLSPLRNRRHRGLCLEL